jgi:hypothetical protein
MRKSRQCDFKMGISIEIEIESVYRPALVAE